MQHLRWHPPWHIIPASSVQRRVTHVKLSTSNALQATVMFFPSRRLTDIVDFGTLPHCWRRSRTRQASPNGSRRRLATSDKAQTSDQGHRITPSWDSFIKGSVSLQYGPERRFLDGRHGLCDHVRAVDELFWVVADDSELRHAWPMESWSSSALVVHHALPPACRVRVARKRNIRPEAHLVALRQRFHRLLRQAVQVGNRH